MKGRIDKELKYITIIPYRKRDIAIPFFLSWKHKRFINKTSSKEKESKFFCQEKKNYENSVGNSPLMAP